MEKPVVGSTRRVFSTLFVALLLSVTGAALSVSVAAAGPHAVTAGSAPTPGTPTGTLVLGKHSAKFCVAGFKPHTTVTVTDQKTGQVRSIHTSGKGSGCTKIKTQRNCAATTHTIVATGTGADGNPATVTETVTVPADPSLCGQVGGKKSSSSGALPFTGSDIIIPGIIIGLVLIAVGTAMTVVRRRRADTATA